MLTAIYYSGNYDAFIFNVIYDLKTPFHNDQRAKNDIIFLKLQFNRGYLGILSYYSGTFKNSFPPALDAGSQKSSRYHDIHIIRHTPLLGRDKGVCKRDVKRGISKGTIRPERSSR